MKYNTYLVNVYEDQIYFYLYQLYTQTANHARGEETVASYDKI